MPGPRRDADPTPQRDKGSNPLQRGRTGREVRNAAAITDGPSTIRDARDSTRNTRRPPHHALKPKGDGAGYGPGETCPDERPTPFGCVTPQRQSQEGKLRREAKAILVVSSSEGRTPRARLDETSQGGSDGSKASKPAGTARTQQDPEEATPGVVARPYRVALKGKKTSREPMTLEDGVAAHRVKLWSGGEVRGRTHELVIRFVPAVRRPRGGRTTGWDRRTDRAIGRRGFFEGPSNRKRGGRIVATRCR
jgi:hypothetical protein